MPNGLPEKSPSFFEKMNLQIQNNVGSYMGQRLSQFITAWQESSKSVRRFLFLTNAGSAVAIVSFMGAAKPIRQDDWSWRLLGIFLLGILLLGLLEGFEFHRIKGIVFKTRQNIVEFMENKISLEDWNQRDDINSNPSIIPVLLAWGSFACLIIGFIFGFVHFSHLKNLNSDVPAQIQQSPVQNVPTSSSAVKSH